MTCLFRRGLRPVDRAIDAINVTLILQALEMLLTRLTPVGTSDRDELSWAPTAVVGATLRRLTVRQTAKLMRDLAYERSQGW